jgi:hypothetical protein
MFGCTRSIQLLWVAFSLPRLQLEAGPPKPSTMDRHASHGPTWALLIHPMGACTSDGSRQGLQLKTRLGGGQARGTLLTLLLGLFGRPMASTLSGVQLSRGVTLWPLGISCRVASSAEGYAVLLLLLQAVWSINGLDSPGWPAQQRDTLWPTRKLQIAA